LKPVENLSQLKQKLNEKELHLSQKESAIKRAENELAQK